MGRLTRTLAVALVAVGLSGSSASAIVGGAPARPGEVPYMVALQNGVRQTFCGGSLIRAGWVLTAAHCVDEIPAGNLRLQIGATNVLDTTSGEVRGVAEVLVHPRFNGFGSDGYDVALLRLTSPSTKFPVNLGAPFHPQLRSPGYVAKTAGWGASVFDGPMRTDLWRVGVVLRLDETMEDFYPGFDALTMIGAGGPEGTFCEGDSGGPLAYGGVQLGVVSWDPSFCHGPGVFARVANGPVLGWIGLQIPELKDWWRWSTDCDRVVVGDGVNRYPLYSIVCVRDHRG
jgi:secreted trypsin-like serine protease